jgi:hypothetical protein
VGLGRADPLEQLPCLPQQVLGFRAAAGGRGAAAQAGQRLGLIVGAANGAGEVQCLLVTLLSTVKVTADPVLPSLPGPARRRDRLPADRDHQELRAGDRDV